MLWTTKGFLAKKNKRLIKDKPGLKRDEKILTSNHEKTEPFKSSSTFIKEHDLQTWRSKINIATEQVKTKLTEPLGIVAKAPLRIHEEHRQEPEDRRQERSTNFWKGEIP